MLPATFIPPRAAKPSLGREVLRDILREVLEGAPLAPETAVELLRCDDPFLPNLLSAAQELKEKYHPGVITYSRKVFLPLTNLCRDYCGYCTFRRDPGEPDAHTMTPEEVLAVAKEGEKLGCTEALFSLGDRPEAIFPEMRIRFCVWAIAARCIIWKQCASSYCVRPVCSPHANPGLLSANWIERLRVSNPSLGLMLESTSTALTAAHPSDRTPDKLPSLRLKTIEDAGKLGVPFTTGILIGIGETLEDRVASLMAIRQIHERYGYVQEVIVQNFRAKSRIPMASWPEPNHGDMLRTLAVARLILREMNIQAPPNLTENGYERLLEGGINDWGGVSPLTPDFINPEAPWPHLLDLQRRTEAAGQKLAQRLPVYPEYVDRVAGRGGLLGERLREACSANSGPKQSSLTV